MEKEVKKKPRTIQVKIGNQAARQMTPDEAASYLKTMAHHPKEVKMTFGKQQQSQQRNSEKEMKALMSMFVEIMGLQMNTDKLNKPNTNEQRSPFVFPPDLPPPPGGWPEIMGLPIVNDSDNDQHSKEDPVPALEDIQPDDRPPKKKKAASKKTPMETSSATKQPVSGLAGIAPFEWEALERVAIEDALEQEERARKAAKKRGDNKKSTTTSRTKKDKAQQRTDQAEAAAKKREKALHSWRSRVASACQSNEVEKLEQLLAESPLKGNSDILNEHLEWLVPHTVPKNRQSPKRKCRQVLANYILSFKWETFWIPLRNGRSAFHTACFYNDTSLMQQVLEQQKSNDSTSSSSMDLETTCQDSGWTPLQYAVLSGSMQAMEILLAHGAKLTSITSDTHTYKMSNGKGLTAMELVDAIVANKVDKEIETHGMALQEVTKDFMSNAASDRRRFLILLQKIANRLKDVACNGYSPLEKSQILDLDDIVDDEKSSKETKEEEPNIRKQESLVSDDTTSTSSKKDKKQKKKTPPTAKAAPMSRTSSETSKAATEDPVITALKGMGFAEDQILAGVKACGGIDRATADDVVAWIFGQEAADQEPQEQKREMLPKNEEAPRTKKGGRSDRTSRKAAAAEARSRSNSASDKKRVEAAKRAEEQRVAADKLAAKREEQRRRNREWNSRQAQVHQQQEAQTGANRPRGGLAPASNFLPAVNVAAAASTRTQKPAYGLKPPPSTVPWTGDQADTGNDGSTVASSNEHGSVEIGNDDATVSTLGSVPTTRTASVSAQSTPVAQPSAPPGFTSSVAAVPESRPMDVSPSWDNAARPIMPPRHESLLPPPPGIPESRPFVDMSGRAPSMPGVSLGGPSLPARQDIFSSNSGGSSGNSSLLSGSFVSGAGGSPPMGSSSLFTPSNATPGNVFGRMVGPPTETASPAPPSMASSVSGPPMPLGGFGLEAQKSGHALDSSVIDSISTGNASIGGAMLWGDHAPSGPSLLGNLIQTNNSFHEGEQDSLFSSQHSRHENIRAAEGWRQQGGRQSTSFHGSGHPNTGSGSIW